MAGYELGYQERLVWEIERARRELLGKTAPTIAIQSRMGEYKPERTLRYQLLKLEQKGWIHRPLGPKSGWAFNKAGYDRWRYEHCLKYG